MKRTLVLFLACLVLPAAAAWAEPIQTGELHWPHRLYLYMGPFGYLSCIAWAAAVILLFRYRKRTRQRTPAYSLAVVLALTGFLFSGWASNHASSIEVDHKWEEKQRKKREAKRRAEKKRREAAEMAGAGGIASGLQFAEDTVEDRLDVAGKKTKEQELEEMSEYERAVRGELGMEEEAPEEGTPDERAPPDTEVALEDMSEEEKDAAFAYRGRGPAQRREGVTDEALEKKLSRTEKTEQSASGGLVLPMADRMLADEIDGWNRYFSKWILVAAVALFLWNYVSWFNTTFDVFAPLPVAGPWFDFFYAKRHAVLANPQPVEEVRAFLLRLASKGETFVYFGPEDPVPHDRLCRFALGGQKRNRERLGRVLDRAGLTAQHREALLARICGAGAWIWAGCKRVGGFLARLYDRLFARRWPQTAESLQIFMMMRKRDFAGVLMRLPFVLLLFLVLIAPTPLFFSRYDPGLYWYLIVLVCALSPLLVFDTPIARALVDRYRYDGARQARDTDFVYEAAWFGRACFSVTSERLARGMLLDLRRFLHVRGVPRAHAFRTVNIVWEFRPPPAEVLRDIVEVGRQCNLRFVYIRPERGTDVPGRELYEEVRKGSIAPDFGWKPGKKTKKKAKKKKKRGRERSRRAAA